MEKLKALEWKLRYGVPSAVKMFFADTMPIFLAYHLPRRVAYWAAIRVGAHATCGEWGNESPTEVSMMTILKRWEQK